MAACDSTTSRPARRNSFAKRVFADLNQQACPIPLFVKGEEGFEQVPNLLLIECARLVLQAHFRPGTPVLQNLHLLHDFLTFEIGVRDYEAFGLILLDGRDGLIDYVELFRGSIDTVTVHSRPIVECVLKHKATGVILVHNHPNGRCKPSDDDLALTERLKRILVQIEVRVLDHLIVGASIYSFADHGLLRPTANA
jgi:DNA repair protein RadC